MNEAISVVLQAVARPAGDGLLSLVFTLGLRGGAALEMPAMAPFLAFTLQAQAGGVALPVHQPPLDLPVQPVMLRLAPDQPLLLHPPVRLRLGAPAAGDNGLLWSVAPAPAGQALQLRVRLLLPPPLDLQAVVQLPP